MRWYHWLIVGLAALLMFTTCSIVYIVADRQSGGGQAAARGSIGKSIIKSPTAQAAPLPSEEEDLYAGPETGDGYEEPVLEPCHHCGGSGEIPCGICGGDGMAEVDCPGCGGNGYEPCEDGG